MKNKLLLIKWKRKTREVTLSKGPCFVNRSKQKRKTFLPWGSNSNKNLRLNNTFKNGQNN